MSEKNLAIALKAERARISDATEHLDKITGRTGKFDVDSLSEAVDEIEKLVAECRQAIDDGHNACKDATALVDRYRSERDGALAAEDSAKRLAEMHMGEIRALRAEASASAAALFQLRGRLDGQRFLENEVTRLRAWLTYAKKRVEYAQGLVVDGGDPQATLAQLAIHIMNALGSKQEAP